MAIISLTFIIIGIGIAYYIFQSTSLNRALRSAIGSSNWALISSDDIHVLHSGILDDSNIESKTVYGIIPANTNGEQIPAETEIEIKLDGFSKPFLVYLERHRGQWEAISWWIGEGGHGSILDIPLMTNRDFSITEIHYVIIPNIDFEYMDISRLPNIIQIERTSDEVIKLRDEETSSEIKIIEFQEKTIFIIESSNSLLFDRNPQILKDLFFTHNR